MAENKSKAGSTSDREIVLTRLYDAPREIVWEAWADPDQAALWWGPRGFTLTTHSYDLKTGGHWHYTMHGPDGVDHANKSKYIEVEKYSRLVYDHGGNDEKKPMFRVTVQFTDVKGKTRMEMTTALPTAEAAEHTRQFIKKAGGDATWDRLAEYLTEKSSGKDTFVINRTFDAPIERVFEMLTDPQHFSQWMGPAGSTLQFLEADIKTGGYSFYRMPGPGGANLYGKTNYVEVHKPDRLVYTQSFCDEKEKIARHPMSPTWPETMLTTVVLAEEGKAKTRVTLTWEVFGEAKDVERGTFHNAKAGMTQGWGGSFDKLDGYLVEIQKERKNAGKK